MNVLFIGHEATRTGAPILLLNLIRWLKDNTDISCRLILGKGGAIACDYASLVPTKIIESLPTGRKKRSLLDRLRGGHSLPPLERLLDNFVPDIVYCNTLAVARYREQILQVQSSILLHVHELDFYLKTCPFRDDVFAFVERADQMIVVSQAVRKFVIDAFDFDQQKVQLIPEFIPLLDDSANCFRTQMKIELGIPIESKVVVCCGTQDWRKGAELAVPLLEQLRDASAHDVHLVWIGGDANSVLAKQMQFDAQKLGLEDSMHHVSSTQFPSRYLSLGDVFALLSREDPYPVAMLEAASLGKPIFCFKDSGGATEFVQENAGVAVPYLKVTKMAESISCLFDSPQELLNFGQNAKEKARSHDINLIAPKILQAIQETY